MLAARLNGYVSASDGIRARGRRHFGAHRMAGFRRAPSRSAFRVLPPARGAWGRSGIDTSSGAGRRLAGGGRRAGRPTNSRRSAPGRCGCIRGLGAREPLIQGASGRALGLMRDLGVPGSWIPSDPSKLWIDWDRPPTPSTSRRGRARRGYAAPSSDRTENGSISTLNRLNPFGGKLRPGGELLVKERVAQVRAREAARAREVGRVESAAVRPRPQSRRDGDESAGADAPHRGPGNRSTRWAARRRQPSSHSRRPAGHSRNSRCS